MSSFKIQAPDGFPCWIYGLSWFLKNGYIYISAGINGIQISQDGNKLLAETQHHQIKESEYWIKTYKVARDTTPNEL